MSTTIKAAVLWATGTDWSIEEIELDDPKGGEVLVRVVASGLCHSDDHARTGDMPAPLPMIGGHEGAGVVETVGPGVTSVEPGDHVCLSFIPSCGRCHYCSSNQQYLCDLGSHAFDIPMSTDGRFAHHCKGEPIGRYAQLGTFAERVLVSENSVIRVDKDLPLDVVALVSCGVATGFGSATERAGTKPGETVAVIGVGGIGMNAVQGARIAGASNVIAIDPVEMKRVMAMEFGATHTYVSVQDAAAAVTQLTRGRMCDRVVLCPGVVHGNMVEPALGLTGKGGTLVVTGVAPVMENTADLNLFLLSMLNKEVKGTIFGSQNPRAQIPNLLAMYRAGSLKLDELVTRRYSLEQINDGYLDMLEGRNIRGIIEFPT